MAEVSNDKRSCNLNRKGKGATNQYFPKSKMEPKSGVWKFPCLLEGVSFWIHVSFRGRRNLALGASLRFRCPKGVLVGFRGLSNFHIVGWENFQFTEASTKSFNFNHKNP